MKYLSIFERVRDASRELVTLKTETINNILLALADEAEKQTPYILTENQKDLDLMDTADPKYDRLKLTEDRIKGIAADIRNVVKLPSPLAKVLESRELPNGLKVSKVTVPLGVVGIIYEARPNVTFDVFSLCLKSGNACLLKGGSDAKFSNEAIISVIKKVLADFKVNTSLGELLPVDREATHEMLTARGYVDVIIPRGSQQLINYVADNAKIPVIETGAGIVHTYVDEKANLQHASEIINNAKTRRCSVCNALDCLVLHSAQLPNLAKMMEPLAANKVTVYADGPSFKALQTTYPKDLLLPATGESYGTEFLSMRMSIKTVNSFDEALQHIQTYSSKHSEAIVSDILENIGRFLNEVDAAAVYSNTSTAYTDGAQFGLGAEIGISTQKLHARGPMALAELTSYKWIVRGNGQVRPK
ncbi:MAG TPA: glutamate-5-semialdehyde dehydrogenase [Bacteroidales bacterium]|nr:glutamate-5-semialdehyde dehydrogenase [Bacteroidales bacterium]